MVAGSRHDDDIVQAAWLYHVGRLSQQEVSERLGISRFKVLRMLADAREQGMVRISIEHRTSRTLALADRLTERFGLREVLVAPVPVARDDDDYCRLAVGIMAAAYLARVGKGDAPQTIGVGWGRTLSSMADNLVGLTNRDLTFVSLMGSVTHATSTAPAEVCVRLAAQTGGQALLMPAPFVADSEQACQMIMAQRLVREALDAARRADRMIMSVGECRDGAILFDTGVLSGEQIAELKKCGVVGDCCGNFFMPDGTLAETGLNRCTPCIGVEDMRKTDVAITAGGLSKAEATLAILRAGFADRLFVDEHLAGKLLAMG
ncbi:MAG: sugar-binding transcriptional regulator [Roseitalea sp.]|nr:sugar-binding transcriptional regulator [Roseitalea sp.]MBO6950954.1 sugar-binding transcriptional regulator [Rhizobiaceae bacterium]MBO6591059.1 sugar-binding transcriptional regulator [Roseitalea sp.]MBO6599683.1 sugar-binding transcriptional regulator [Roseitalea sp.]MBO6611439.1 sugar-binding transcriptional regulator [Roseitalea sp.]